MRCNIKHDVRFVNAPLVKNKNILFCVEFIFCLPGMNKMVVSIRFIFQYMRCVININLRASSLRADERPLAGRFPHTISFIIRRGIGCCSVFSWITSVFSVTFSTNVLLYLADAGSTPEACFFEFAIPLPGFWRHLSGEKNDHESLFWPQEFHTFRPLWQSCYLARESKLLRASGSLYSRGTSHPFNKSIYSISVILEFS
jgi:hypothetical protein